MSAEQWDQELRSAGFAGIKSLAYDGYLNNNIIAMPSLPSCKPKRVTLLLRDGLPPVKGPIFHLEQHLIQAGYQFDRFTLEEISARDVPENQDIVSVLDLDGIFFRDLDEHMFFLWKQLIVKIRDSSLGLLWLTRPSQVEHCVEPEYGVVIGLARMLRKKDNLDFATVEIDFLDGSSLGCVVRILDEFHGRITEEAVQPTMEWAIVSGHALIGRYQPINVPQELQGGPEDSTHRIRLIDMLHRAEAQLPRLGPDDVEIDVKAVGLSFEVSCREL